jgi:hypothetical protein
VPANTSPDVLEVMAVCGGIGIERVPPDRLP